MDYGLLGVLVGETLTPPPHPHHGKWVWKVKFGRLHLYIYIYMCDGGGIIVFPHLSSFIQFNKHCEGTLGLKLLGITLYFFSCPMQHIFSIKLMHVTA